MKCPCCKTTMIERTGKFGEFLYCRDDGTLSLQGKTVVATGNIKKHFSKVASKLELSTWTGCVIDQPSLMVQMESQMLEFGVKMNEIDRFIEGETLELMQLNAQDDEDHWLNTRHY